MGLYSLPSAPGYNTNFKLGLQPPSLPFSTHVFYHAMNKIGKVSPDHTLNILPNSNTTLCMKPSPGPETEQVTRYNISIALYLSVTVLVMLSF